MALVQSDGVLVQTSPNFYSLSPSVGGGVSWYNGLTQDYAAIYRTQPNVRLVVNFFARNIAQINIKAYERVSDTERRTLSGTELTKFIRRPNPMIKLTRQRWLLAAISDLKIFDNTFWLKVRNPNTGQLRLFRLPPELMVPSDDSPWFFATSWKFLGVKSQPVFSSDDLIHHCGFNPTDPRMGLSPIETIRQLLREDQAREEYREKEWKSGSRISGVIERPPPNAGTPKWSDKAKNRFIQEWRAEHSGGSELAGGTAILEDGMQFKPVAFSAKDSEYIASRKLSREETAAIYHLSPLFVGILENANFSNVSEQHKHLYQDAFGPDLVAIEEDLELQLLNEFDDIDPDAVYLEFNLEEKLKGSFEEEAGILSTATGAPYLTRNEARARRNLPPVAGGDLLVTPLNVLIGGQASPRDSAPPPGAASRALPSGKKDASDLPEETQGWYEKHVEVLSATFDRQKESLVSALGGGQGVDAAWNDDRWNDELKNDLLGLSIEMSTEIADGIAELFGGEYDPDLAFAYLDENARIASENVNEVTKQQLSDLDADDEEFLDSVRNVFAVAAASRAAQIAVSRVTSVGNFARQEAATQSGVGYKVWKVRSSNSRHPGMNGEKVEIGEKFSNGARWPGDQQNLDEDETANCTCQLDFEV